MIMAALHLVSTTLFYFEIDLEILSYLGGVSFLTLGFLYLSSYAFKFCEYNYYNVSEEGEQAAYLIGYIVQRMHRVFKDFTEKGMF